MRLHSSLPIIGRISSVRPTLLPLALIRNASRLSSIHDGLRRSERARPQGARTSVASTGPKLEIRQPDREQPYLTPTERRRGRAEARQNPITYKIKKGKKDVTERSGPGRIKNAGQRYGDPRDPLGSNSLIKKFKTGKLAEELRQRDMPEHIQHDDFARQMLAAEVDELSKSRKWPTPAGSSRAKSDYSKRQEAPPSREIERPRENTRSTRDREDRDPPRPSVSNIGLELARGAFALSLGPEEGVSHGASSQPKADRARDTPRKARTADHYRSERGGSDRELSFGGIDRDNSGRETRDRNDSREARRVERSDRHGSDRGNEYRGSRDERPDRRQRDWDTAREAGRLDRSDRYGSDRDVGYRRSNDERPDRRQRDWDTPREAGRSERSDRGGSDRDVGHRGSNDERPGRRQRDWDTPREAGRSERSDRRGSDRGASYGSGAYEPSGRQHRDTGDSRAPVREQRPDERFSVSRESSSRLTEASAEKEEAKAQEEKPKKKPYVPPVSIHYTTAASQFLYGTSTVEAALSTSRRKLYKLYIYQGENRSRQDKDEYLARLAETKGVPVEWVPESQLPMLNKMSSSRPHNGHILEASPLPQLPVQALGEVSTEPSWPGFKVERGYQSAEDSTINGTAEFLNIEPSSHKPFVLLLDEILDPQNLGAILRTASYMGVSAVATSKRGSAPVTPVVLKASSGAAETMTMLSVESPLDFLAKSKANGWRVYAAVPPKVEGGGRKQVDMHHVEETDPLLRHPCVLVMGSEGEGLSWQLRRAAHTEVTIPNLSGSRVVDSLNVGVATALLCSAFVRGRGIMANSGAADAGALF